MSKLENLIAEFCPDGVQFTKIENLCTKISSGGTPNTGRSEFYNGDIPWLRTQEVDWVDIVDTGVRITTEGLENSSANWIPKNCVIVAMYGATAAKVAINKIPLTTNQACCNLQVDERKALFRYVYFWMCNKYDELKALGQGSQSNINAGIVRNFPIALPPLEVQREIVRILDNFTELTAELTARKKQHNYYRNLLLRYNGDVPIVTLSQCCKSIADGDHQAPPKVESGVPFITISNISNSNRIDFTNTKYVPESYYDKLDNKCKARENDILYTVVGSFGVPVFIESSTKFAFQRHIAILRPNSEVILPKYLYHVLQSSDFLNQANTVAVGAAQKTITLTALNKMKIPLPSIARQTYVVDILDRFNALVSDVKIGLPAEIEARRKQYEYYRDKLLTF